MDRLTVLSTDRETLKQIVQLDVPILIRLNQDDQIETIFKTLIEFRLEFLEKSSIDPMKRAEHIISFINHIEITC